MIASDGDSVKTTNSGNYLQLANHGDYIQVSNSGNFSLFTSDGYSSKLANSGDYSLITSNGDSAQISSSGDYARINSSGEDSAVCCAGNDSCVKAKLGSWITLSEWKYSEEKEHHVPVCVKTEQVDGKRIKEDTFYRLKNGEFVEVKE